MGRFEYLKWNGKQSGAEDEFLLFYEVDLENERYATRMAEVQKDGSVKQVVEDGFEFVTETPVPTINEINSEPEWQAELITKEEFEEVYNSICFGE